MFVDIQWPSKLCIESIFKCENLLHTCIIFFLRMLASRYSRCETLHAMKKFKNSCLWTDFGHPSAMVRAFNLLYSCQEVTVHPCSVFVVHECWGFMDTLWSLFGHVQSFLTCSLYGKRLKFVLAQFLSNLSHSSAMVRAFNLFTICTSILQGSGLCQLPFHPNVLINHLSYFVLSAWVYSLWKNGNPKDDHFVRFFQHPFAIQCHPELKPVSIHHAHPFQ